MLVFIFCPILYAARFPNNEYLLINPLLDVPVTVNTHVVAIELDNHNNDQVYLVIIDQIYFVAENVHQVRSVDTHE